MSKTTFELLAAPWILRPDVEGGFSNHRNDRGGATNHGITLSFLELLPDGDLDGYLDGDINRDSVINIDDIRALNEAEAKPLYYRYLWKPSGCDELPFAVALCLFDGLVNHKPGPAKRLLQMGLRVNADGIIGSLTRAAASRVAESPAALEDFLLEYLSHRAVFYNGLVTANSSQASFLRGWHRRLFMLMGYILTHN